MAGGRGGKAPPPRAGRRRDEAEVALEGGAGGAPRGSGERLTRRRGPESRHPKVSTQAAQATGRSAAGAAGLAAVATGRPAVATGRSAAGAAGLAAVAPSRGPRRRSPWRSTARAVSPPRAHPTSQLPSAGPPLLPRGKASNPPCDFSLISPRAMGTQLAAAAAPIPSATTTTISSLSDDELREIFLRLPNLRALVRAALTCRAWLRAVRSSRHFRRLFRALHPAPLIGIFVPIDQERAIPSFFPLRRRLDPDISAALRGGDFFLTSLPLDDHEGWYLLRSQDGYLLLRRTEGDLFAAVNPVTRAMTIIPKLPVSFIFFHPVLLCSDPDEHPRLFRVVCLCLLEEANICAAVFSSETSGWVVHPWVHLGRGSGSLSFNDGTLVNGSVYWPVRDEHRMVRLDTSTMNISFMDLPLEVDVNRRNFRAGDTKDGQLCIVYVSDCVLHVWIRGVDRDGIEIWVPHNITDLNQGIYRLTDGEALDLEGDLEVMEVRSGYVYSRFRGWFFSLSLETLMHELLLSLSERFDDVHAYLYFMAWPRSLVGDDGSTGHGVESSH